MPATPEEEKLLAQGLDYLGKETSIGLTGTSDIPAGATGLPAPSAPGGMAGFAGGPGARPGAAGGGEGGPSSFDLAKGALSAATKTAKFGAGLLPEQTRGYVGGEETPQTSDDSLSDQLRSLAAQSGIDLSQYLGTPSTYGGAIAAEGGAEGLRGLGQMTPGAGAVPSGVEAVPGAGAAGALGTVGGGAAAIGAILSLLAQATGDPELAKAAEATGVAGNVVSLGGTAAALPGMISAASTLAPTATAGAGALGGAGLGAVGGAAGAALAPIAAFMIYDALTGGKYMGSAMKSTLGDYSSFTPELMQQAGRQGGAFGNLEAALPYVQSKEELGQLLNTYRNYLGTTTGITPESYGSIEGAPGDVYSIGKIPGVGPVTHGQQTPTIDWGPRTQALMDQVSQLYGALPGEPITAKYGEPGGGLEGPAGIRLWEQFLPGRPGAPAYSPGWSPVTYGPNNELVRSAGGAPGFYSPSSLTAQGTTGISYGEPGYDYAAAGWPEPGQYLGQVSPYWQQLQAGRQAAGSPVASQIDQMIAGRAPAGAGLAEGMLTEEERRRAGV